MKVGIRTTSGGGEASNRGAAGARGEGGGPEPPRLENEWIARALQGDTEAFHDLYGAHARRVKAYFLRSGFTDADAEDLTQDTFVRVYRSLRTFDPTRGRFVVWVSAIAKNVARRRWSSRKRADLMEPELAEEILSGGQDPRGEASAREEIDAVRQCIAVLDEELRRIVSLRYVGGLTTRALAGELETPEATVRLRLREAQGRIRRCLQAKGVLG